MLGSQQLQNELVEAKTIKMTPVVSAEWNQNLFNPPYITIAGSGIAATLGGPTPPVAPSPLVKQGFTTKVSATGSGRTKITFPVTNSFPSNAYKVITYVRTNNVFPVIINTYAKTGESINDAYGSKADEATSFSWTKIETYIGGSDAFATFDYSINAYNKDSSIEDFELYFTEPEVYAVSQFDYLNGSLWPTDSPFMYFRPGESYVGSGNQIAEFPEDYRVVPVRDGENMPVSPILYCPRVATFKAPINNFIKNGMLSDISPYKYFVSSETDTVITAKWKPEITANKIIFKFQTLVSVPEVEIYINSSSNPIILTVDPETGVAIIYWNGSGWTTNKWESMPVFDDKAELSLSTSISKITVSQTNSTIKPEYESVMDSEDFIKDFTRMHLIEVSPRLEIDLSDLTQSININKSLDNGQSGVPISSIDSNDASISLSSIPFTSLVDGSPLPIFSNEDNSTNSVLANLLRKNVKFHIGFDVEYIGQNGSVYNANEYVQGGVFFADSWQEQDVDSVSVTLFDVTRYLQTTPVPDYISKFRPVIEIISDIFDFAGFTDYDYQSLYEVCNNEFSPVEIAYYFANSKEKTIFDAIREIFLAYQIGAFVDEWGIIRFTTLTKILQDQEETLEIDESQIVEGTFSLSSSVKPGKISVRYQSPKILQSASIQNIQDTSIINSPSFVLTTSNDVVWQQQSSDSCGFNYLQESMAQDDNFYTLEVADLLDIFHTYSVDFNGYGVIEDEIVSFEFKEYIISGKDINEAIIYKTVSVTNNIDLQAKINDFIKNNKIFREDVTVTPTGNIVNVKRGMFGTQARDHDILGDTIGSKGLSEGFISNNGIVVETSNALNARVSTSPLFYHKNRILVGVSWYI